LQLFKRQLPNVGAFVAQKAALGIAGDVGVQSRVVADHQHIVLGDHHVQLEGGHTHLQRQGQ
jgi:hypothetical protein